MKPSHDDLDRPASVQVVAPDDRWGALRLAAAGAAGALLIAGGAFYLGLSVDRPAPPPVVVVTPTAAPPAPPLSLEAPARERVELVFAIDTTGSMGGLLRAARQKAWSIVDALATRQVDLRVGLVAYRDHRDEYVTRMTQLTPDVDAFYQALHGLRPIGGGDDPEAVADALRVATRDIAWSAPSAPGVRRLIVVMGDAPPHAAQPGLTEVGEALQRGIRVSTVRVGDDAQAAAAFAALAAAGQGSALHVQPLAQGHLAQQVVTPLDAAIAELQRRIEATVVPWGTEAERQQTAQRRALNGSLGAEQYASRASALSKTGGFYERDLLAALEAGRVKLEEVRPEDVQGGAQALANLEALRRERAAARAELDGLVSRRDAWLKANARAAGLEAALLDCLGLER